MLGEKRSRKRAALLTTIIMLVASVIPTGVFVQEAEAAADTDYTFKYYDSNSGKWLYKYGYNIEYGGNSTSSTCMFKVFDTEDNYKVYYTYCCDLETYTDANGTFYRRTNIENADHFDAETARKIRTVVINGYTPPTNNSETIKSSIESIQSEVNAWMERKGDSRRLNLDLSRDDKIETAEKTMITATQISIWSLANSSKLPIECTDNSAKNNVDMIRDYLLDVAKTETPATATTIEDIDLNIGSIVQVADENSAVISGTFAFYNKAEDPRRIVSPPDNTNIKLSVKSGTKPTVILEGALGELMQSDDEGLEIVFNEETLTYSFEIKHSGLKGKTAADITITATGTQKMPPGAYFYKAQPKNGKDEHKASQNFVGIAEWEHDFDVSAVHDPIAATLSLDATKVFKTVDGKTNALTKGQFEFVLKEVVTNGNRTTKNVIDEATNDTEGNVTFDPITYSKEAKTYKYEISEVVGSIDNVVYDTSAYSVTVTVALNADKTAYVAVPVIKKNDVVVDKAVFENIAVKPATVSLTAKKTLNGNEPGEDKFEFILSEKTVEKVKVGTERVWNGWRWQTVDVYEDKITLTEIERKHNDTKGDIQFSPMSFDANGSHTYIISEVVDNDNEDIIYDGSVYEVKVDVALNGAGTQYVATSTITKTLDDENSTIDSLEDIVFENRIVAPEKTSVSVAKVWDDNSDQDGIRPESVTVQLYANGEASGEPVVLNSANGWSYTWEDLTKKYRGETFAYTVDEVSNPAGYEKSITGNEAEGYIITNTYTPAVTTVKVTKTWDDNNDQDGIRPDSVKVQLKANGENSGAEITLNADNNWTYQWTDLPKNKAGKAIKYTVDEVSSSAGYTKEITGSAETGYTIKGIHIPETVDIEIEKLWEDLNDIEGLRAENVTITLKANDKTVRSIPVSKLTDWNDACEGLPKYEKGKEIDYTITVDGVPEGYETEGIDIEKTKDGKIKFTVKSKYVPKTSVTITKVWEDADDQDGKRPESVQIQLLAGGEELGDPVVLNEETGWTYKWENLSKYGEGNTEVKYTVEEVTVPAGYTAEITGSAAEGYTVTNTHEIETTKVPVDIVWNDADDQDGVRPDSIKVQLQANGKDLGEPVDVTADDKWAYEWQDLDKYDDGKEIIYTVIEPESTSDYKYAVTSDAGAGYTITGTHEPETIGIEVNKLWEDLNDIEGLRSANVIITLKADDKEVGSFPVSKLTDWNDAWEDLPKYEKGKEIDYSITVDGVPEGYETEGIDIEKTKDGKIKFTVKSKYVPKTSVAVTNVWEDANDQDGLRPESVQIQLLADGEDLGEPIVLDEKTGWTYKWEDLIKYGEGNAQIEYTVKELSVPAGYTAETTGSEAEGYTITNTHIPEEIDITVLKKWNDNNDQDGLRPDKVEIQLYGDNKKVGEPLQLTKTNEWNDELSDLPKNEDGKEIDYTIDVKGVPEEYSTEITEISDENKTDLVVTSTYVSDVSETKTGDDSNMILWAMMLLTSLSIMILILAIDRRRIQH